MDCTLQGEVPLRPGVSMAQVLGALETIDPQPLRRVLHRESGFISVGKTKINMEDGSARFCLRTEDGPTLRSRIEAACRSLDSLASRAAIVRLEWGGDGERASELFFVGPSAMDKDLARVRHGLSEAQPWLAPVLGHDYFVRVCGMAMRGVREREEVR